MDKQEIRAAALQAVASAMAGVETAFRDSKDFYWIADAFADYIRLGEHSKFPWEKGYVKPESIQTEDLERQAVIGEIIKLFAEHTEIKSLNGYSHCSCGYDNVYGKHSDHVIELIKRESNG